MSKIADALSKSRGSRKNRRPEAVSGKNVLPAVLGSPSELDDSGIFESLDGFKQVVPIPEEIADQNRLICSPRYQPAFSPYKILRTRVLHRMRSNRWNRLAITSCGPGEGKSLTAINLAISLALQEQQNVVLLDLDLIHPSLYQYLGIEPEAGLSNYFNGGAQLEDLLISPGIDRLLVLGSETPIENSSETLRSSRMLELLDKVASRDSSSIIVFDMPPLLRSDDVLAFGPLVDALLLVVTPGKTSRVELEKAKEYLQEFNLLGTALNKSSESTTPYY
jgi:capsular exopolysaccharide synthesis family protein